MAANRPKPLIDTDSQVFWEGVQNHELKIQHCDDCQQFIFYPRFLCPHCFSENLTWRMTSGKGIIHSYTVVHKAMPPFAEEAPYVVGIIELQEGVRMMSRIEGERSEIAIDKPVSVFYKQVDEDTILPYFQIEK